MGHNSERLWKPINWLADLQPFFGIVGGLAYITHTITARSDLNPWSQNKPFCSNATSFADDNARQAALRSVTHGFTIPQLGTDAYFKAHYKDKWVYNPVTSAYPARSHDYDGYVNNTVRDREWGEEGAMGSWINTIFGGVLSLKRSTAEVYDNDTFNFDLFDATPPLAGRSGLLRSLRGVEFDWNSVATENCKDLTGHDVGLIAQEVESLIPSAIGTIWGEYKRLDYTKITPYLVEGWKAHDDEIHRLKTKINKLEERIYELGR